MRICAYAQRKAARGAAAKSAERICAMLRAYVMRGVIVSRGKMLRAPRWRDVAPLPRCHAAAAAFSFCFSLRAAAFVAADFAPTLLRYATLPFSYDAAIFAAFFALFCRLPAFRRAAADTFSDISHHCHTYADAMRCYATRRYLPLLLLPLRPHRCYAA